MQPWDYHGHVQRYSLTIRFHDQTYTTVHYEEEEEDDDDDGDDDDDDDDNDDDDDDDDGDGDCDGDCDGDSDGGDGDDGAGEFAGDDNYYCKIAIAKCMAIPSSRYQKPMTGTKPISINPLSNSGEEVCSIKALELYMNI